MVLKKGQTWEKQKFQQIGTMTKPALQPGPSWIFRVGQEQH